MLTVWLIRILCLVGLSVGQLGDCQAGPGPIESVTLNVLDRVPDPPAAPALPVWQVAWGGRTPATDPSAAEEMSRRQPEVYRVWLEDLTGRHVDLLRAKVTAYCPCAICCGRRTNRTADGANTDRVPYGIAADWRLLPDRTLVHVPGYLSASHPAAWWPVDDSGQAMHDDGDRGVVHIDIRYQNHRFARAQGVRWMWIYRLDER